VSSVGDSLRRAEIASGQGFQIGDGNSQVNNYLVSHRMWVGPGLPVRLAPRLPVLAGRETLLADIDSQLAAGPVRPGPRVAVLCGLGGVGKTSLAVEYAHRQLGEVGACWQFAAEDPTLLGAEFEVLAAQLGARDVVDARDPVAAVHAALASAQRGWLLVFDNVRDLAAVQAFLPPAGPGRILMTSQSQHWPAGWPVQVPVLDREVGAQFLASRTGHASDGAAAELAVELGGLPLAVEQAASYMQASGTPLPRYLALFRARQADLLARGEAPGHRQHVAATLGLALTRLEKDAPAAAGLLRLLAFLAPDPVPLPLLLGGERASNLLSLTARDAVGPLLADPIAVGDAISVLRRYSLVSTPGDDLVLVHRLVQAVTRAHLSPEAARQWQQDAAALVELAVPADARVPETWYVSELLLPHARTVLPLTSGGMRQVARYLGNRGSYLAARDLFQQILDAHKESGAYGPPHPQTFTARHDLAVWTGVAGDPEAARDQLAALLLDRRQIQGPEHTETLSTRNQLTRWTGDAGDPAAARDQAAALVPVCERVLGPEHRETLTARSQLTRWTGESGDPSGARDQAAALLPVRERVHGPGHPAALFARMNLARWTGESGDAAGARDQYAALLRIRGQILGPEHPDTLTTRFDLATWTGRAGDPAAARDQYAAVTPVCERVLGPRHPDTLSARSNLTYWARQAEGQHE
jgi:hypothetical protein